MTSRQSVFFSSLLSVLLLSGCTGGEGDSAKVHLVFSSMSPENRTSPSSASSMDCLFVNVRGSGVAETFSGKTFADGVQASCLNLGTVSTAVSLADAITDGVRMTVKAGSSRAVEVLGYSGQTSCQGKTLEELLNTSGSLYLLGSSTVNLTSESRVEVANAYVSGSTPDKVAGCKSGGGGGGGGGPTVTKIYRYDGSILADTGLSVNGSIHAMYFDPASSFLFVGGEFENAGGVATADNIAIYDWTDPKWMAVDGGLNGAVRTIVPGEIGKLYLGGDFTKVGGVGHNRVVRVAKISYNFEAMGTGIPDGSVRALHFVDETLFIGGTFTGRETEWSHDTEQYGVRNPAWTTPAQVNSILYASSTSSLLFGGNFTNAVGIAGADYLITGTPGYGAWANTVFNGAVHSLAYLSGNIYVFGEFTQAKSDVPALKAAYYSGTSWSGIDNGFQGTPKVSLAHGAILYVGGDFTQAGSDTNARNIAKYTGTAWEGLSPGLSAPVTALASGIGSNIYIAAAFPQATR